ncbi:MAG: ubiquinol-cytochrome C chaperone family protein [Pseudomonadota bacterium]
MFQRWFKPDPMKRRGKALYEQVLEASRRPALFGEDGVPDTVDGRFDILSLHMILAIRRLNRAGSEGRALAQAGFDAMFKDMDEAVRNLGAGDMTVGKKIRKMAEAFYGRAQAYEAGLDAGEAQALAEVIGRNMLDEIEAHEPVALRLADYALRMDEALAEQADEAVLGEGGPRFPAVG